MGIEPTTLAWKAKVIPFYDTRINIFMRQINVNNYLMLYQNTDAKLYHHPRGSSYAQYEFKIDETIHPPKLEFKPDALLHPKLASRQGLEPRPTVLETGMLPLH